jgi:protein import protein ZIM17
LKIAALLRDDVQPLETFLSRIASTTIFNGLYIKMPPTNTSLTAFRMLTRLSQSSRVSSLPRPTRIAWKLPQTSTLRQPPSLRSYSAKSNTLYESTANPKSSHKPHAHTSSKSPKPEYEMTFTCKPCSTRSTHRVSKQGYHYGSVLITCPECRNRHVISDHLNVSLIAWKGETNDIK